MKVTLEVEHALLARRAHAYAENAMRVFRETFVTACGDGELRDAVHRIASSAFAIAYQAALADVEASFERAIPVHRTSNPIRSAQLGRLGAGRKVRK